MSATGAGDLRARDRVVPAEAHRRRRQPPFAPRRHGGGRDRRRLCLLRPPARRHARRAASEGARACRMVVGADGDPGGRHGRPVARQRRAKPPRRAPPSWRFTRRSGRIRTGRARPCGCASDAICRRGTARGMRRPPSLCGLPARAAGASAQAGRRSRRRAARRSTRRPQSPASRLRRRPARSRRRRLAAAGVAAGCVARRADRQGEAAHAARRRPIIEHASTRA